MRRALAALIDVVAVAVLSYGAFRLAIVVAPCADLGSCPSLTPLVLLFILIVLAAYFGLGSLVWHRTPGERITGLS